MEYRAFITVPGLPVADEAAWMPVIEHLERHTEFGPIISWESDGCRFVLSTDAADPAQASDVLSHAVVAALRATGHGDLYPSGLEIEPADETVSLGA